MASVPRWLPNAISALRVAMVPGWALAAESANRIAAAGGDAGGMRAAAAAVLLAIGASDLLDGWLARRFRLQSHPGATLDALADKLAQVVVFTWLALRTGPAFGPVPVWFLLLLVGRDAVLLVGCALVKWRVGAVRIEHRRHGKAASLLLFVLAVLCTAGWLGSAARVAFAGVGALVVVSTALYVRDGFAQARVRR